MGISPVSVAPYLSLSSCFGYSISVNSDNASKEIVVSNLREGGIHKQVMGEDQKNVMGTKAWSFWGAHRTSAKSLRWVGDLHLITKPIK